MKPHLIPSDRLKALETIADETLAKAAAAAGETIVAARRVDMKDRWRSLDAALSSIGGEISSLLIILLAVAILCAPVGLGLAAIYYVSLRAAEAAGHRSVGWVVAILGFAFLCRYVWGAKLQLASRRAAEALIAAKKT